MKNYLIIGASSGIGNAVLKTLVKHEDVSITATYLTTEPIIESNKIEWVQFDVTNDSFDQLTDKPLNGIVYCPGSINLKPFKRIKKEELLNELNLNFFGFFSVLQKHLENMKHSGSASVVAFSSVAVHKGLSFHSLVNSSKGALESLVKSLAIELAPNIRLNVVAPSLTKTPLAEKFLNTESKLEQHINNHPLKAIGDPGNIAEMVSFLLSDKSKFMTGQSIIMDGGFSL